MDPDRRPAFAQRRAVNPRVRAAYMPNANGASHGTKSIKTPGHRSRSETAATTKVRAREERDDMTIPGHGIEREGGSGRCSVTSGISIENYGCL